MSKIFMTVEEQAAHEKMLGDLREGAQYIGEEGSMCALAQNKRRALSRMKEMTRRDVGEYEARVLKYEHIFVGWARVATPDEIENNGGEWEWYVHYKKPSAGRLVRVYAIKI